MQVQEIIVQNKVIILGGKLNEAIKLLGGKWVFSPKRKKSVGKTGLFQFTQTTLKVELHHSVKLQMKHLETVSMFSTYRNHFY